MANHLSWYTLLVLLLALSRVAWGELGPASRVPDAATKLAPADGRMYLRTEGGNRAGMGSISHQLRRCVLLAEILRARLLISEYETTHGYDAAFMFNRNVPAAPYAPAHNRVCRMTRAYSPQEIASASDSWCREKVYTSELEQFVARTRACDVFVDDRPFEYDVALSNCTWQWMSAVVGAPPAVDPSRADIALHIRWGDMGAKNYRPRDRDWREWYRSIPIPLANAVVGRLRSCLPAAAVRVYMEGHSDEVLRQLAFNHSLVDTGDDLADLASLAGSCVMVVSGSSYTMMAHQAARGCLTVVPGRDKHDRIWRASGTNEVLEYEDFTERGVECAAIIERMEAGRERSRLEIARQRAKGEGLWYLP